MAEQNPPSQPPEAAPLPGASGWSPLPMPSHPLLPLGSGPTAPSPAGPPTRTVTAPFSPVFMAETSPVTDMQPVSPTWSFYVNGMLVLI